MKYGPSTSLRILNLQASLFFRFHVHSSVFISDVWLSKCVEQKCGVRMLFVVVATFVVEKWRWRHAFFHPFNKETATATIQFIMDKLGYSSLVQKKSENGFRRHWISPWWCINPFQCIPMDDPCMSSKLSEWFSALLKEGHHGIVHLWGQFQSQTDDIARNKNFGLACWGDENENTL